jgi:hypothetical protein
MNSNRAGLLVKKWKEGGTVHQEPINWKRAKGSWLQDLPNPSDFIEGLPLLLDRVFAREIFDSDNHAFEAKFATVMIWEYGVVGFGSYRTKKMFGSKDFLAKIEESYHFHLTFHFLDEEVLGGLRGFHRLERNLFSVKNVPR